MYTDNQVICDFNFNNNLTDRKNNINLLYDNLPDILTGFLKLTETNRNIHANFILSEFQDFIDEKLSITFWVKPESTVTSLKTIIYLKDLYITRINTKDLSLMINSNTAYINEYYSGGGQNITSFVLDTLKFVTIVIYNKRMKIYVNGSLIYQDGTDITRTFQNESTLYFGRDKTTLDTTTCDCSIDDFRIINENISAIDAVTLYNLGRFFSVPYSANYTNSTYELTNLIDYTEHNSIINYDLINSNGEGNIYYNNTETTPTTSDDEYATELTIVFPCVITAKVISENGQSENYTTLFTLQLPDPVIDKYSQDFTDEIVVNISKELHMWGHWIYTTDGTEPSTTNGELLWGVSQDLTFTETTTLKIYLYDDVANYGSDTGTQDFIPSNVIERTYTKINKLLNPYAVPAGCNFRNDIEIELINTDSVGEIYYTLDNTEPAISSLKYSGKLKFKNGTLLKFKTISEDNESETIEEIYIKTGGNVKMEQAAGLKVLKWIETGETDEVILGEGTVDGAVLLSIIETPVFFNSNYAGASPIGARINTGANTFTADIHISDDVKQYISTTFEKSGTKFIFGMNTGAEAKTGQLTIHSMYDGEDTTDDIILYKVVAQITDEIEGKIEGKKLTKLIFTVLADKKEITALSAPTPTIGTEGTLAEAKYTYMIVASNDFGRVVSPATAEQTIAAPNDMITLTIPTLRPLGANKTNGYRMYRKKEIAGPTITYGYIEINSSMVKAGAVVDNGTLTWTTATAFPVATVTVPWYYAQGEC